MKNLRTIEVELAIVRLRYLIADEGMITSTNVRAELKCILKLLEAKQK